jgi:hypothetical protein
MPGTLPSFLAASLLLAVLSLVFAGLDLGIVLCFGIAIISILFLIVRSVAKRGKARAMSLAALAACLLVSALLLTNYMLVRDHVRWLLLSGVYKEKTLAQPVSTNGQFKHVEWDGWGWAGMDTTVYLAFDPSDSLAANLRTPAPVNARGLPCGVARIRRLESHWYAVLFYTDNYWGKACHAP